AAQTAKAPPAGNNLAAQFTQTVRPFLARNCTGCHSGAKPAASFDLSPYATMDDAVRDYGHWNLILEKLASGQMPPKPMKQPLPAERKQIVDWIEAMRTSEAQKNAGDPGPVLARRLSNAEYNYSIRDLTGVDLKPTREFPVDPANPAGFDNSGESLTMSPALLNKYLQAAREVSNHMVLTPDGFNFSPHPMLVETDREKYAIMRIVNFYASQPTDYADYFQAAWRYKHRAALNNPNATLASVATAAKLSQNYLPMVWKILGEGAGGAGNEVGPIAKLQSMWRALPTPGENKPEELRKQCEAMRDWVVTLRKHTAREFASPRVRGLSPTSQPLMNYKFRQFNTHRRDFDRNALRMETDPPIEEPVIPKYPGLGQESAYRAAALMQKSRMGDLDLIVPTGKRAEYEDSFARFAHVFPDVFYIQERGRFFPDDSKDKGRLLSAGYHNVMGYWRDDQPLQELILDEAGRKELDKLWIEFDYIGDHTMRTYVQYYFNQSGEVQGKGRESGTARPSDKEVSSPAVIFGLSETYLAKAAADPSNDPVAMTAIRYHFQWVNDTLRSIEKLRVDSEPQHLDALLAFAARAYRRALTAAEREQMLAYYGTLRQKDGLTHEEAIRDSIVSILMSPKFCYRIDLVPSSSKAKSTAVTPAALASRLSYFLWSTMPDAELLAHATSGDLTQPDVLLAQTRRMLQDGRSRGLATEFAGNWLDFRRFEDHNAVDRTRFPSFDNDLREAMFEEPVRFIEDVIRNGRSVLDMLYGDYTFANPVLAKHYGMPEIQGGNDKWIRVDNASRYGRGGIIPMAVFLTQNSPGLRTSPVKRGYWVVRRVLGEQIPPPPPTVPELPSDESKAELPLRAMLEKHRANPACASCHARFDSFGLAFEGYGPVGERRGEDLAGRPVDSNADFPGGVKGSGIEGVQAFIRGHRQNDFIDNLCRKMLAYAFNRSLILSDEPVVDRMKADLAANGYRFPAMIEAIVASPQFLNKRSAAPAGEKLAQAGR
ncbi:MAG: DUF1592 domain-containing protein, partial [Acidobacteriota bacterium]